MFVSRQAATAKPVSSDSLIALARPAVAMLESTFNDVVCRPAAWSQWHPVQQSQQVDTICFNDRFNADGKRTPVVVVMPELPADAYLHCIENNF